MACAPRSSWSRQQSLLPPSMLVRSGNVKFLFDEWENKMNDKLEAAITVDMNDKLEAAIATYAVATNTLLM
jgi:uncharacterized protein (DUF1697 family)